MISKTEIECRLRTGRALSLWAHDNSLILALDVCRGFLAPIEYLSALWPCEGTLFRSGFLRTLVTEL